MIKEKLRGTRFYYFLVEVKRRLEVFKKIPKPDYTYAEFCEKLANSKATFMKYGDLNYTKSNRFPFEPEVSLVASKKTVFIRHDIDHSPFVALKMAKVEAEHGLYGSYYMLTTDSPDIKKIWREEKEEALNALKKIQDLGHEVGLHYDLLGDFLESGNDVGKICEKTLTGFREAGINVFGCVAHGSQRLSKYLNAKGIKDFPRECINFNIWEESNEKEAMVELNDRKIKVPFLKLSDYEMKYEAYKVRRNYYHSDNNYVFWQHGDPIHTINNKMKEGEILCILVHPFVWRKNME